MSTRWHAQIVEFLLCGLKELDFDEKDTHKGNRRPNTEYSFVESRFGSTDLAISNKLVMKIEFLPSCPQSRLSGNQLQDTEMFKLTGLMSYRMKKS